MNEKWFAFRSFTPRCTCSIDDGSSAEVAGGDTAGDTTVADATTTDVAVTLPVDGADAAVDESQDADATVDPETTEEVVVEDDAAPEDGVSAKVKAVIESLKKTDPATAKQLKGLAYADAAFRKEFPGGLKEVQQLKQSVTELAGEDGIDGLRKDVGAWKSIDDRFAKGDASVLQDFAKFNPDSFEKIIPPAIEMLATSNAEAYGQCMPSAIDKLSQVSPDVYSHYMSGVLTATLDNYKVSDTLGNLVRSLGTIKDADGNVVASQEIAALQSILKTVDGFRELAQKAPVSKAKATPEVDPRQAEYDTKFESLRAEKAQIVSNQVGEATNSYATAKYEALIPAELKSFGLNYSPDSEQYKSIVTDIDRRIGKEIDGDNKFKQKYSDLVRSGKIKDAIKLANSRFELSAFKAVRSVVTLWSKDGKGKPTRVAPVTTGAAAATKKGGVVELQTAPEASKVDWDRTTRQQYLFGEAYLKGDNKLYKF